MSTYAQQTITGDRLRYGFQRQVWWSWLIGTAFFFGEVGAGLFLVSLFTEFTPGLVLGFLIVMIGKNSAHLMYLGRPERFWRAALRPDRSWIARGIWATGFYGIAGALLLAPTVGGSAWALSGWAHAIVFWVAAASALFIMFYDGFVMSSSSAVPFWSTPLLPLLCLTYAALGGTTLWLVLHEFWPLAGAAVQSSMLLAENALILINLFLVALYVFYMARQSQETSRFNALLWIRGMYAPVFWGLVLAVGLVITFVLAFTHFWVHAAWIAIAVAVTELSGDYALLILLLKSGLYRPQREPS